MPLLIRFENGNYLGSAAAPPEREAVPQTPWNMRMSSNGKPVQGPSTSFGTSVCDPQRAQHIALWDIPGLFNALCFAQSSGRSFRLEYRHPATLKEKAPPQP